MIRKRTYDDASQLPLFRKIELAEGSNRNGVLFSGRYGRKTYLFLGLDQRLDELVRGGGKLII